MAKKSDNSLFINFFFNSLKKVGLFINFLGPHYSLFIIFLANDSLFIIRKGHYSLIIIPHLDLYAKITQYAKSYSKTCLKWSLKNRQDIND